MTYKEGTYQILNSKHVWCINECTFRTLLEIAVKVRMRIVIQLQPKFSKIHNFR